MRDISDSILGNIKIEKDAPRAMKNLSYRQSYRFFTRSPKTGSSGRT